MLHELMDALSGRNCSASSALSFALLKASLSKLSNPGTQGKPGQTNFLSFPVCRDHKYYPWSH